MNNRLLNGFILMLLAVAFFACKDNDIEKLRQRELEKLDQYIQDNHPGAKPEPSGLFYFEVNEGTGDTIHVGDRVQIFYATYTIDSVLIDQTSGYVDGYRYDPYEFTVGAGTAISGLEQAATLMQKGTVANLVIPSELAYKQSGTTGVPGFTTLLMQVEVYKIYPAQTQ